MKFLLLFSCIFVLCLAKIEPGLGLEETGKDISPEIEDFLLENEEISLDTEDKLEDNISDDDDEKDDFPNARIAGGKNAIKYAAPYHVALTVTTTAWVVRECCGVLVTASRILSLKTCVAEGVFSIMVRLGVLDINNEGESGRVTFFLTPLNTHTVGRVVDGAGTAALFSLIKIVSPIPLSRRIHPIRLPTAGTENISYIGHLVQIAGFGRYGQSRLRPVTECESATLPLAPTTHVCFFARKDRVACTSDIGCPITTNFRCDGTTLLALVSVPATDCDGERPRENTIGIRVVNALNLIAADL